MAILIFAVVLFVLVLVHELGHFWVAKRTGMRVDEFGIGFPPRLLSVRRGETRYSLNALPIGGFVRIHGEDAGQEGGAVDERSFVRRPKWAQALVLVAGVAANVLLAWVLFAAALSMGVPQAVDSADAGDTAALYAVQIVPESPAAEAGIPPGARIDALSAGGETVAPHSSEAFSAFVRAAGDTPLTVTYTHSDETHTALVAAERNVIEGAPERAAVGIALGLVETRALPVHEAVIEAGIMTVTGLRDIVVGISSLIYDAFTFEADFSQVAGPVGIVGLVDDASALGLTTLLMFTAVISLNLAVINLLPFPALDGGRLLFVAIETLKGSPIPSRIAYYANATGFVLLMLLMVAITYNDILRIL